MKKMSGKFVVFGFWIPVLITLWLNPGRNSENIYKFSEISLLLLACCGLVLVSFAFIGLMQPKVTKFIFTDEKQPWADMIKLLLALILGVMEIYSAASANTVSASLRMTSSEGCIALSFFSFATPAWT